MSVFNFAANSKNEEEARQFCIDLAREFGVRSKHYQASTPQERRWLSEGMKPIYDFETFEEAVRKSKGFPG